MNICSVLSMRWGLFRGFPITLSDPREELLLSSPGRLETDAQRGSDPRGTELVAGGTQPARHDSLSSPWPLYSPPAAAKE